MKKLFTLSTLLLFALCVSAQEKKMWDFTQGLSYETIENLNADATNWSDNGNDLDGNVNNWKNNAKPDPNSPLMANGVVIPETAGLLFDIGNNKSNSIHLATTKLRLNRKGTTITFPQLVNGEKITIVGRSANSTVENRGIAPSYDYIKFVSGTQTNGACIFLGNQVDGSEGTYTFVWQVQTDSPDPVDVKFQLTPDAGIDFTLFMIDDCIPFADATVKSLCVKNWDTNGDGELSLNEAAAVKSLGTVFKSSKITSFNELQYFTGLTSINEGAFSNSTIKEVTLPETIKSLGQDAFLYCKSLLTIHLPASLETIEFDAIVGCSNMTSITVAEGNKYFCDIDGVLFSKDKTTLLQFPPAKATNYTVPEGTKVIGTNSFFFCKLLTVTLPKSLVELGYDAFGFSPSLTELSIPDGVKTIGDYILDGCKKVTKIYIPHSVTKIGQNMTRGCNAITDVYCDLSTPFAIEENNFTSTTYANATLHVRPYLVDTYKNLEGWKYFANIKGDVIDYAVTAEATTINLGETAILPVLVANNGEIDGIQFDFTLPEGVSVATDMVGGLVVTTTDRTKKLTATCAKIAGNTYRVILLSINRAIVAAGNGAVLNIQLQCADDATDGDYDIAFTNVSVSRVEGDKSVNVKVADFTAPLTVVEISKIPGDVDGNFTVDVTDVMIIVDYILNRPCNKFNFANADLDGDGTVNVTDAMNVVNIILHKDNTPNLELSLNSVELEMGKNTTVIISSGSGNYEVSTSDNKIALAALSGNRVSITGKAIGKAVVTVKDTKTNKAKEIVVTVVADHNSYLTCPDDHHPHLIDLGLPSGTKWACCNVDTDHPENQSPTNYGGYYAWGETETKSTYSRSTYIYIHYNGSSTTIGYLGSDIAGTKYDVAYMKWGDSWMMPSNEQQCELRNNCTYEWKTMNGVYGGIFTSKTNGGSIFLPAAGYRYGSDLYNAGSNGCYWSSEQAPASEYYAYDLHFGDFEDHTRECGLSVRPVYNESIEYGKKAATSGKVKVCISPTAQKIDRDLLRLGTSETGCQLHTAFDAPTVTALQMEVTLPKGCCLNNVSLTGKAARSHMVKTYQLDDHTYNVVVFSIKGSALDTDAPFLQLDLEGNGGLVEIENILCTDTNHESLTSPNLSAEVTGITTVTAGNNSDKPVYNLAGQRLERPRKGINITNGKKMVVK